MAKSKKSASAKTSTPTADNSVAEARPIGAGKDPLAEGNTLKNPTNSEAETHYEVKERGEDVTAQDAQNKIDGQDANARAEAHNAQLAQGAPDHETPNQDEAEQDEVAAGREETPAAAEGSGEESPAEEDPLAKEANEKAV